MNLCPYHGVIVVVGYGGVVPGIVVGVVGGDLPRGIQRVFAHPAGGVVDAERPGRIFGEADGQDAGLLGGRHGEARLQVERDDLFGGPVPLQEYADRMLRCFVLEVDFFFRVLKKNLQ